MGWVRTSECGLCGKDRCVVSSSNSKMGYCFRFGKTYFVKADGRVSFSGSGQSAVGKKEDKRQNGFDFGDDFDNHLEALST